MIAVVGLLVIGPERLPETLRTIGLWLGRMRRSFVSVKAEIEKEIGMDEVKRQLHNEAVMDEMKRIEREVKNSMDEAILDPNMRGPDESSQPEDNNQTEADANQTAADDESQEKPSPLPASEAELEAAHAARAKAKSREAAAKQDDNPPQADQAQQ